MTLDYEHSAGVIPFRLGPGPSLSYLIIHSARVLDPRARWEFPKGGIERGETPGQAAAREFREETGITSWAFVEGFASDVSYAYVRHGRKHVKTVTYFIAEVFDNSTMIQSAEHMMDPSGRWYRWGSFDQISLSLCHSKTRRLFAEADTWLRNRGADCSESHRYHQEHANRKTGVWFTSI
jgi:bis(5'-nucleosidyl)-tetraphosphatase